MECIEFWLLFILAATGAVRVLAAVFPRAWDAIVEAWGVPERDR